MLGGDVPTAYVVNMRKELIDIYKKYKEVINYLIVGIMTTVVSLLVYYVSVIFVLDPNRPLELQIANIVSWVAAVSFSYGTNRRYVFFSNNTNCVKEAITFFSARVTTLLMDMVIMFFLVTILKLNDKIAKIIVQFFVTVANYILSKYFVFKK